MSRSYPIARVRVYEAGQEAYARYDGFGRYDVAGDLFAEQAVRVSEVDPAELGIWSGQGYRAPMPAAMHVRAGGLNTVMCRPFLDTTQAIGLGHFAPVAGTWRGLKGLGLGQEVKLYQSDGTSNRVTGMESRFALPHNPLFALSLYRAEPGPEHDWGQPPYTEIHFGIGEQDEWALVIPYGAPMFVMRRRGGQWTRVHDKEKAVRWPTLEGVAKGQRLFLWIGALRGRLAISTDGFADDVWVCETPEPLSIKSSKVTLWHNAGQWAFSFLPIKMTPAKVYGPVIETGYPSVASKGEVTLEGRMIPVVDDAGAMLSAPLLLDDSLAREGLTETQRSWQVQMAPHRHIEEGVGVDPDTGQAVDFETWVSPEWLATQVAQEAEVAKCAAPVYHDLSTDAIAVHGEHAQDKATARYQVALDNQRGQHAELREYRRASVAVGWKMSDGTEALVEVIDGQVVEPPVVAMPGGTSETRISILDPMLRLRDEKADGRTPVFDGWPVVKVIRWVLARCGVPVTEQDLEDTGTVLSSGTVEQPVWQVEPGRSWVEFLQEVARFDYNAAIWFDEVGAFRKTCRYCRQKRTAAEVTRHDGTLEGACDNTVRWEMYTRGKVAPNPQAAGEVLDLRRTRKSLAPEEYANYVVVSGMDEAGRPVKAVTFDAASLYDAASEQYVGWRKMEVVTLPGRSSQEAVNRIAAERLAELSARPEHVRMVTPLLPEARVGQVLRISGGEKMGVNGQCYRIEAVRHQVERRQDEVATTVVEAKWLG
ncbi:MAG: hypothetical protein ABFE08_05990 [Armatimonadia bacterium]